MLYFKSFIRCFSCVVLCAAFFTCDHPELSLPDQTGAGGNSGAVLTLRLAFDAEDAAGDALSARTVAPKPGAAAKFRVTLKNNGTTAAGFPAEFAAVNNRADSITLNIPILTDTLALLVEALDSANSVLAQREVSLTQDWILNKTPLSIELTKDGTDATAIRLAVEFPASAGITRLTAALQKSDGSVVKSETNISITGGTATKSAVIQFADIPAEPLFLVMRFYRGNSSNWTLAGIFVESVIVYKGFVSDQWIDHGAAAPSFLDKRTFSSDEFRSTETDIDIDVTTGGVSVLYTDAVSGPPYTFFAPGSLGDTVTVTIKPKTAGGSFEVSLNGTDRTGLFTRSDTGEGRSYTYSCSKNDFIDLIVTSCAGDGASKVEYSIKPAFARRVASTGFYYYDTLSGAVSAAPTGTATAPTITVLEDLDLSGNIGITGKHIKLIANGKTITRKSGFTGSFFTVNSGASLTLEGSGGGNITLDGNKSSVIAIRPLVRVDSGGVFTLSTGGYLQNNDNASTEYNSAVVGGAVNNSGTFYLNGGTICGNRSSREGGGIYNDFGTVNLLDGSINNNTANSNGGGVYSRENSTINMSGGTISNNTATYGGGVCHNGNTFTMSGSAKISDNTAATGGGARINSGGFTMKDSAEISHNKATGNNGGGISAGASFTMENGTISDNEAAADGGGVHLPSSGPAITFTMLNGTINNNKAGATGGTGNGGGVYDNNVFTMQGGTISGNTATGTGGGVHNGNTFTMSDGAVVNTNNDVYLNGSKTITVNSVLSGTGTVVKITPSSYTGGKQVLNGDKAEENVHRFTVSDSNYYVYADAANAGMIHNDKTAKRTVSSVDCYYPTLAMAMGRTTGTSATNQDTVTLLKNIDASAITLASGKHIKLNGGKTIRRTLGFSNGAFFTVSGGASLTLTNITLDGGAVWSDGTATPPSPAFNATNSGITAPLHVVSPLVKVTGTGATLTLGDNAVLQNNSSHDGGAVLVDNGKLIMDSDTAQIAYNRATGCGGGVDIVNGGNFELKRGTIHDNDQQENDGGGVYAGGNSSAFTMSNGIITKNRAAKRGGGVATAGGNFTMSGGTIEENYAGESGGGVRVADGNSRFEMSGGEIKGNSAAVSGSGVFLENANVSFTMSGGAVVNTNNDVYLTSGKVITVNGNLTANTAAKVTPSSYGTTQVLNGAAAATNNTRFGVTPSGGNYYIVDTAGKLQALSPNQVIWLGQDSASGSPYNSDTGTFVIPIGLKAKVFLVGGGGSGAMANGGGISGGGKGGDVVEQDFSAGNYNWSIGAGGAWKAWSGDTNGNDGGNTRFGSSTATGGAGGNKNELSVPAVANGIRPSFFANIPTGWTINTLSLKDSYYGAGGGSIQGGTGTTTAPGATGGGGTTSGHPSQAGEGTFFGAGGGAAQQAGTAGGGFRGVILVYLQTAP